MQPIEGHVTVEDGVRLFYQQVGSGPPVFLPNGFHLFDDFQRLAGSRTLIFYDVRNRGRSDTVSDRSKLARGILQDADDLDAVRRYFGIDKLDLIAHSYMGVMAALYARTHPDRVNRVVQIGPGQPNAATQYPSHLTGADATLAEVLARLAQLRKERQSTDQLEDPREACERFWSVLRPIYVLSPADAEKIHWGRCELPNERNFWSYWSEHILPSIQQLRFSAADLAHVQARVLVVHGAKDRAAPYGGGREWALLFPNARLVTVENAGHAPWIEAPDMVFGSIQTFLDGQWPEAAENVTSIDPQG
ncbi:MAG: alpha/beta fold hydrolase [Bryobacteraceae bacterium]